MKVNAPGDIYEQEADRVSEQLMRAPGPQIRRGHERLQAERVQSGDAGQVEAPPVVHEVLAAPGRPLDPATRDSMGPFFGHDLGRVRVHADARAGAAARALKARAFTVGSEVVFAAGRYSPHTRDGRRLLAHELVHTLQQQPHRAVQRQDDADAAGPASAQEIYDTYGSDNDALGRELYRLTSESPDNVALVLEVLDLVSWLSSDDVAYYFVQPLSDEQLREIASYEKGRELLSRLSQGMQGGIQTGAETSEIERLNQALSAPAPDEGTEPPPSPVKDAGQIQAVVTEVIADRQIDAPDWAKLSKLDSDALESSLVSQNIPEDDADLIALIATRQEPLFEKARSAYTAALDPSDMKLANDPLTPVVGAALEDLTLTLEEARILREVSHVRGADVDALLAGFDIEPSARRALSLIITSSLSFSEQDRLLPISLRRGAEGALGTQSDLRVQTFQTLFQKKIWRTTEKRLAHKIMQLEPHVEVNQALLKTAGLEDESARLLLYEEFESRHTIHIAELELLHLSFEQTDGNKWALTKNSKYNLSLPFGERQVSQPEIVEEELAMEYIGRTTITAHPFESGVVEDAEKLQAVLGVHPIEVVIAKSLAPKKNKFLDQLDYAVLLVPAAHSKLIKGVEFDPGPHPKEKDTAATTYDDEQKIVVWKGRLPNDLILLHEIGHLVENAAGEGFLEGSQSKWRTAMEQDGVGVSLYSFNSYDDDFAEAYQFYGAGGKDDAEARKRYAHRFAILDKM